MIHYIMKLCFLIIGAIVVIFVVFFMGLIALAVCMKLTAAMGGKGVREDQVRRNGRIMNVMKAVPYG